MCAEQSSISPAGEEYKLPVPPAETLVRVAVANPAWQTATTVMKPGRASVQAVMRKREGNRAPANIQLHDGRAFMGMCARQYRGPHLPDAAEASSGSKTIACTHGSIRELGRSLQGRRWNSEFQRQGLSTKSRRIPSREVRCLLSSWEVR